MNEEEGGERERQERTLQMSEVVKAMMCVSELAGT